MLISEIQMQQKSSDKLGAVTVALENKQEKC